MTEDWIESQLQQANVPPSGESRERTVTLARAIAPRRRTTLRSRIARPGVVVPLAVLMIAAMTAPGQAATGQVGSIVARIVPLRGSNTATIVGTASTSRHAFSSSGNGAAVTSAGGGGFATRAHAVGCGRSSGGTAAATRARGRGVVSVQRATGVPRVAQARPLNAVPLRRPTLKAVPLRRPDAVPRNNR